MKDTLKRLSSKVKNLTKVLDLQKDAIEDVGMLVELPDKREQATKTLQFVSTLGECLIIVTGYIDDTVEDMRQKSGYGESHVNMLAKCECDLDELKELVEQNAPGLYKSVYETP